MNSPTEKVVTKYTKYSVVIKIHVCLFNTFTKTSFERKPLFYTLLLDQVKM